MCVNADLLLIHPVCQDDVDADDGEDEDEIERQGNEDDDEYMRRLRKAALRMLKGEQGALMVLGKGTSHEKELESLWHCRLRSFWGLLL